MTWFRVGGAGIPASLKNNMNSVLNKKFGTSGQNYPPKQWPDDVNLLGPLPTKTASGSIASFPDGADTVPVKSCKVAFGPGGGGGTPADPVALVGYSSVNVVKTGKNLLPKLTPGTYGTNGVTFVVDSDGVVTMSGTTNASGNVATIPLENDFIVTEEIVNNFKFHLNNSALNPQFPPAFEDDSHISAITPYASPINNVVSFSASSIGKTITQCRIWLASGITVSGTFAPAIMTQSSATAYTPFVTPETISDSFGQTVLGGQRDLTTDGMDVNRGYFALTDELIDNALTYTYSGKTGIQIQNVFPVNVIRTETDENGASHDVVKRGADSATHYMWFGSSAGNKYLYWIGILDHLNMTLEQWKTWAKTQTIELCYPLQTPTQLTGLTAHDIETNYADNNFYADIQDSTMNVEYRADIALALQAVSSSRGLMMASRPVTQLVGEESDPDQVNELVENDETEQEGEDNAR